MPRRLQAYLVDAFSDLGCVLPLLSFCLFASFRAPAGQTCKVGLGWASCLCRRPAQVEPWGCPCFRSEGGEGAAGNDLLLLLAAALARALTEVGWATEKPPTMSTSAVQLCRAAPRTRDTPGMDCGPWIGLWPVACGLWTDSHQPPSANSQGKARQGRSMGLHDEGKGKVLLAVVSVGGMY